MNIKSWYVIILGTQESTAFEKYLNIMQVSSKHIRVCFSAYKSTGNNGLTISYYISEDDDYIYNFMMYRYRNLEKCTEPININSWATKII